MLVHILIAVDPPSERNRIRRLIQKHEVVDTGVPGKGNLLGRLTGGGFDMLVVTLDSLPTNPEAVIGSIRSLPEQPEIVVLTSRDDSEERAALLAHGCLGILDRRLGDRALGEALGAMITRRRDAGIQKLLAERPEERYSLADFVSDSPVMQLFLPLARRVVHASTSLLILGETGVGKERLARAIHAEGPRSGGPFMAVNCGALPESLLESELYGHEEGAFTGATRARKGYFELAHRGTLFLDEIGEIPNHLQVKLLRVLDQHRIQRVGGEQPIDVDVRVMAATNRDLEADVESGRFRSDLYYRLAVVTLQIPPLRERREDIPPLVNSYLEHFRTLTGRHVAKVQDEAMQALVRYDWPGNVRELVNAVERAVLLCGGSRVSIDDLPARVSATVSGAAPAVSLRGGMPEFDVLPDELMEQPLAAARRSIVTAFETRYVARLLEATKGRVGEAALRAGINERSLYDLMRRHGLRKEQFRGRPAAARVDGEVLRPRNQQ
jgi:DNA-binding NtrC family response regulator